MKLSIATLYIVVPCYNECEVFPFTVKELTNLLSNMISNNKISDKSRILFVDDGSRDNTWELISNEFVVNKYVCGLKLAGNVGHQNALFAGLMAAKDNCDITVSIDADLQDDTNSIIEMVDKYYNGFDIVYGVRSSRKKDTFFKRTTAQSFYKFMSKMGVKTVYNHADFRLMSSRAVEQLSNYPERNMFLRGIVPLIGYKTDCVYYERKERLAGESKYPLKKMVSFAFDGITSFSIKPINFIFTLGIIIILCSLLAAIYVLIAYFCGKTAPGWTSLMLSIWFIGGVQLVSVGLIGQYIGKIYVESKHRPRYNTEIFLFDENREDKK